MKLITALVMLQISSYCYAQSPAQEREYTRQREASQVKSANEASIKQNADNNRPFENKYGSATGVLGRVGHYNGISPARQAEINAINERTKAEWNRQNDEAKRYQAAIIPYIEFFKESGLFDADEARAVTFSTLNSGDFKLMEFGSFHLNAVASYKEFNATVATGGFNELATLALNFCVVPAKSVNALQSLAIRFPERKKDIDLAVISALQGQYGSNKFFCPKCRFNDVKKLDSLFFAMAHKYPDLVGAAVDAEYTGDGYREHIEAARRLGKKGETSLLKIQEEYLTLPSKDIRKRTIYCTEFLADKGLDYITSLAAKSGLKPLDILLAGYGEYPRYTAILFRQETFSIYNYQEKDPFSKPYAEMIHQMAVDGVPEAMNVYALRTAKGWTKDDEADVIIWLRKAAAGGSAEAKQNLDGICGYRIKGMNKKYCDKAGKLRD